MLKIDEVYKRIDRQDILCGVTFEIAPGTITGLIGRNGTGKTTLLRTMVGIYDHDRGNVSLEGRDVHKQAAVKQNIVFVPDAPTALRGYTLLQCAQLYARIYEKFDIDFFRETMERFGLPLTKRVSTLSKGMKMLFSTSLGLATRASYILLDEPTNGIDAIAKQNLLALIMDAVTLRSAVLIASHHLDELDRIADNIVLLRDGRTDEGWSLDALRSDVRKLQLAFADEAAIAWLQQPGVYVMQQVGRVYTVIIESDELYISLQQAPTLFVEQLPIVLDDWFRYKAGGDGDVV